MKTAYFVHDLLDPAVSRRVRMLVAGGAAPVVIGFRRGDSSPETIAGVPAIDLGRTFDGRLAHRAMRTGFAALTASRWRSLMGDVDVVLARTLEMLAVADAARRFARVKTPLVYECLDIHRIMLGEGRKSVILRALERALLKRSALLIVSSPAFLDAYFGHLQGVGGRIAIPTLLVENKVLELGHTSPDAPPHAPGRRPWRLGWMGAIRCRKSLAILTDLAGRRPDLVEVRIHGRPAYSEFEDFDGTVSNSPGLTFLGPYAAEDLPRIYSDVHFSWSIDFMEEGLNSAWLLPNRVYESSRFGATPIALASVETGRFLSRQGFGVRLEDVSEFEAFLERLTSEAYARLHAQVLAVPSSSLVADVQDCTALVAALAAAGAPKAAASGGNDPFAG